MTPRQKLNALRRLRDQATGEDKTALRWAVELAEAEQRKAMKAASRWLEDDPARQ